MRRPSRLLTAAVAASLLAGCGTAARSGVSSPPATFLSTSYGDDATRLAGLIPGCLGPRPVEVATGGGTPATTCVLDGHHIVVYTWPDAASENLAASLLGTDVSYYARGVGWIVIAGDPLAAEQQRQLATTVATALHGKVLSRP